MYIERERERGEALRYNPEVSRVRFPRGLLEFFIDLTLLAAKWTCGRLSLQQKWVPGISPEG